MHPFLPADHRSGPLIRIRSAANVERRFTVVFSGRTAAPHLPRPSEVGGGIEKGGSGLGTLGDHGIEFRWDQMIIKWI